MSTHTGSTPTSKKRRTFIGGNWKMNTTRGQALELAADVGRAVSGVGQREAQVAIYPPFVWLETIRSSVGATGLLLGAQDCSPEANGAHTGDVSLAMLTECGVSTVLVGHSERRHGLKEAEGRIAAKLRAVLDAGLTGVLCIGETLEEREAGKTDAVNEAQLRSALESTKIVRHDHLVVAYEPVWAIGTGKTASASDAQAAHENTRKVLDDLLGSDAATAIRIIYGGSMKPANAKELMAQPDVDGGLIGGASLKAEDFLAIVDAASA
ncbi:MAG: triose-phosphate isomerase [Pseudomonadales bacterium]